MLRDEEEEEEEDVRAAAAAATIAAPLPPPHLPGADDAAEGEEEGLLGAVRVTPGRSRFTL